MNRLLLLLALAAIVALQAVSGYSEDENDGELESLEAGDIELTNSHPRAVVNRVIREAERKGKGRKQAKKNGKRKSGKKNGKGKSAKKNGKRRSAKKNGKGKSGKKNGKNKRKGSRKGKGKRAKNAKKGKGKKAKKAKKGKGRKEKKGKKSKKAKNSNSGKATKTASVRQDTCYTDLVAKTKKFQKYTNQYRKVLRIERFVTMTKLKKEKAASTFDKASAAMMTSTGSGKSCSGNSSALSEATAAYTTLSQCKTTAAALCNVALSATEQALVDKCKPVLNTFNTGFQACLKSGDCSCFQALTLAEAECEDFGTLETTVKGKKNKCVKSSEPGSFGACRAQERMAAYLGQQCSNACGTATTKSSGARSQRLQRLMANFKRKTF